MKGFLQRCLLAIAGVALMLAATVAAAHHSAAMFDDTQRVTLKGTVVELQWTSPHCYLQLLVKGEAGDEEWSLEMAAPMYLYRLGWRPSTLKPGDQVTVEISPLRNGSKGGLLLTATAADGRKLGAKS